MLRSTLTAALTVVVGCSLAYATPLSVDIIDHDFTFDVPYYEYPQTGAVMSAVYDYNGKNPDMLYLTQNGAGSHNVPSYAYAGVLPQVPPNPPGIAAATPPAPSSWLYPTFFTMQHGAKLEIEMEFLTNDGPYTNPAGDIFDVSLVGTQGFLRITGWIGTQGWPAGILYPDPQPTGGGPNDIVLLEIEFDTVTLLARAGHPTADLIEGAGRLKTLLGWNIADLAGQFPELEEMDGVTFFKFMLPDAAGALFPLPQGKGYDPLTDYEWNPALGRISGETGVGIPEPAAMTLLLLGLPFVFRRRR